MEGRKDTGLTYTVLVYISIIKRDGKGDGHILRMAQIRRRSKVDNKFVTHTHTHTHTHTNTHTSPCFV